jgi:8-oxo-dGTP diphosphatase
MTVPEGLPAAAVTADVAVFTRIDGRLHVVLVERRWPPEQGSYALPGGFVETDEDLDEGASRELAEETGLQVAPGNLHQVGAYGKPGRDPRARVVTIAFWTWLDDLSGLAAGDDAADAKVFAVEDALHGLSVAFDHRRIIQDAAARMDASLGR